MESSALALVDGTVYWDMHRPLTGNCTLEVRNESQMAIFKIKSGQEI